MSRLDKLLVSLLVFFVVFAVVTPAFASPAASSEGSTFLLKVPRVVIQVSEDGEPHFAGVAINDVLGKFGLSVGRFDPDVVAFLSDHNVQNLEMVTDERGTFLFVNAQPLPYLAWDKESLEGTGELLMLLKVNHAKTWAKLLPWIRHIGLDVAFTFPVLAGHEKIALRDKDAPLPEISSAKAEGKEGLKLALDLTYDPSGEPELLGMPLSEIEAATSTDLSFLRLPPKTITTLQDYGVKEIDLHLENGGIAVDFNQKPLPRIRWDEASMSNAIWLYELWSGTEAEAPLVEELTTPLAWGDISLKMHFPEK